MANTGLRYFHLYLGFEIGFAAGAVDGAGVGMAGGGRYSKRTHHAALEQ